MEAYGPALRSATTAATGLACVRRLRQDLDRTEGGAGRPLIVGVDGGYTGRTMFRDIPDNTVLIGRVRRDARLHAPPDHAAPTGRPRIYGEQIPTPEEVRQNDDVPWQRVDAFAAGKVHGFFVKTVAPVRWEPAGGRDLRLLVIRPLAYRKSTNTRVRYRQPAYLVCTDTQLPLDRLLQAYLWRWEIEVGFRDQKTLLGMGEAQVRTQAAAPLLPAFVALCYGLLILAAHRGRIDATGIPLPRWRSAEPPTRVTTTQLLSRVRTEMWQRALRLTSTGFDDAIERLRSPQNTLTSLASAAIYATR
jgi:hypothetical protein